MQSMKPQPGAPPALPRVRLLCVLFLVPLLGPLSPATPPWTVAPCSAQPWQPGVADTTLGRFGTWPEFAPGDDNKYEENLVARIWPDHLQRTVNGRFYELGFGARDHDESPAASPAVSILDRSWVFKRIAVDRGNAAYDLAYNALSPGFLLSTAEEVYNLLPPDDFAYFAYAGATGTVVVDLGAPNPTGTYYERATDGDWAEDWMLLWCGGSASLGVQVPILLCFSDHPRSIQWGRGELYVRFDKAPGATTDILCAFLDGVGWRPQAEVAGWFPALPAAIADRCRLLSRSLLPFPSSCHEDFRLDEAAATVTVRDVFGYEPWDDAWATPVTGMAPLPPLAMVARARGYPVDLATEPADLALPTKLGAYHAYLAADTAAYTIPLPPLWTMNLVPPAGDSVWLERAQRQVELWTSRLVWNLDNLEGGGAWVAGTANGMYQALLACSPASRAFYLRRCRNIIEHVLLDFGPDSPWRLRQVPGTDLEYHYLIHFNNHPDYPNDQDCGSGAPLEFCYQYALHSGDWDLIAGEWEDVQKIFQYLAIASDWAWMASACRDYGGGGAFIDMFPSQWMGYLSYAKLARVMSRMLGPEWTQRADFALYLAAKGMIPLTQRLGFKDAYAASYYDLAPDEVCTGFGEYEPKPHANLPGFWCGPPVGSMIDYQAKLIAGERFHPLVDEVYAHWVPDAFGQVVQLGFDLNGGLAYSLSDAAWPYDKIHAFNAVGWNRAQVDQMWSTMHTEESYYWRLLGPPGLANEHAYMYAHQVCRDLPIRAAGNWEPARLAGASYDEASRMLQLWLDNDGAIAPEVEATVLSTEEPAGVRVDGLPQPFAYDPDWGVVRFTVAGSGAHQVDVQLPPGPGGLPPPAPGPPGRDDPGNRILNGGFEECYENPNWMRPWLVWNLDVTDHPLIETGRVHTGQYSMKLHASGASDRCKTFQNIYVGPHDSYTVRFWYDIPAALGDDSNFWVVCQEYNEANPAAERWRQLTIPGQHSPTNGWEPVEVTLDPDPLLPDCTIVRLHFNLSDDVGQVYVDDVELTVQSTIGLADPGNAGSSGPASPLAVTGLAGCRPNPFNPATTIRFTLARDTAATLDIYDVRGQLVRRLLSGRTAAGMHEQRWDGRDGQGRGCASGLYLVRLHTATHDGSRKIVLLR